MIETKKKKEVSPRVFESVPSHFMIIKHSHEKVLYNKGLYRRLIFICYCIQYVKKAALEGIRIMCHEIEYGGLVKWSSHS